MKTAELREKRKKHREELEVVYVCMCVCLYVLRRGLSLLLYLLEMCVLSLSIDCSLSKLENG